MEKTGKRDTKEHMGTEQRRGDRKEIRKADPSLLNAAIGM